MRKKIEQLIGQLLPALHQLKDDYCLIGSGALVLAGLKVEHISDLDLLVSSADANNLKCLWSANQLKEYIPENGHLFRSNFARFNFGEIDVEVMGDLEIFKNNQWLPVAVKQTISIPLGTAKLQLPTLEEQRSIFHLFGRSKDILKAKMIEDFLA